MEPLPSSPSSNEAAQPTTGPDPAGPDAAISTPASESAGEAPAPVAAAPKAPRRLGPVPLDWRTWTAAAAVLVAVFGTAWAGTGYAYGDYAAAPGGWTGPAPKSARELSLVTARLSSRERELRARLKALAPRGVYIVIDQTHNRLYLKKDDVTVLEAVCSAGSGMVLRESGGKQREWVFDTPRGHFQVLSRSVNPIWRKPDWAFVEDGEAIPKNPAERLDYGSMGEYALNFGNGFMIHGTLYERLLGRAVSHGCIRVGRDDLRTVWASTKIGTHIYIY